MRVCMPMTSAREQKCPRIAAKNVVLDFPAEHGRVSLEGARVPNRMKP